MTQDKQWENNCDKINKAGKHLVTIYNALEKIDTSGRFSTDEYVGKVNDFKKAILYAEKAYSILFAANVVQYAPKRNTN